MESFTNSLKQPFLWPKFCFYLLLSYFFYTIVSILVTEVLHRTKCAQHILLVSTTTTMKIISCHCRLFPQPPFSPISICTAIITANNYHHSYLHYHQHKWHHHTTIKKLSVRPSMPLPSYLQHKLPQKATTTAT